MTNTDQLNEEIRKSGLKKNWIAEQLGLSYFGFAKKVNNATQFKAEEIKMICNLLGIISLERRDEIFFADNVDKTTTTKGA